eukprot:1161641-Pelagomonas_calceolata.AAC.3
MGAADGAWPPGPVALGSVDSHMGPGVLVLLSSPEVLVVCTGCKCQGGEAGVGGWVVEMHD